MVEPQKRGLGRGLNALFEDEEADFSQGNVDFPAEGRKRDVAGVDQLEPGRGQPRRVFDDGALSELADSIKQHGVLQPLLVREKEDGGYHIIAGERRWRAAQKAGLHDLPVIVLDISDAEAFEIALIENLQREDLDPIDEANGYQRLIDEHGYTQEKLAESLGKSRSHIANMMRLLQLPQGVQGHLSAGEITTGHARALITAKNADDLAKEIISQNLSVRETEKLVADTQGRSQKTTKRAAKSEPKKDVDTLALEKDLSDKIGMRVSIDSHDGKSGRLSVSFKSLDQLDYLLQRLAADNVPAGRLSA
ncbi:MAG: ParB/RepB/Spo0J family partition protein [Alphaproteobacteria bacterium]